MHYCLRHFKLLAAVLLFAVQPVAIPATGADADEETAEDFSTSKTAGYWQDSPGFKNELNAEQLEQRDETLAAQMEYLAALKRVVTQARSSRNRKEKKLLWIRADFLAEKVFELTDMTGETGDFLALLRTLTPERRASGNNRNPNTIPPLLAARLAWMRATLLLRLGRIPACVKLADRLGFIRSWSIVGPFANERGRNFGTSLGPEEGPVSFGASYPGKKIPVKWRFVSSVSPLGFLELGSMISPNTECLAYALCLVKSPKRVRACLRMGSSNAVKAWLNGRQVLRFPAKGEIPVSRKADLDQALGAITLQEGWNLLMLKSSQTRGGWRLCVRITDMTGTPMSGLEIAASMQQARSAILEIAETPADNRNLAKVDRGTVSQLGRMLQEPDARGRLFYYAGYLVMRRHLGGAKHGEQQLLKQACRMEPSATAYLVALAMATNQDGRLRPDREENQQRLILERIRSLDQQNVAATVMLARYYIRSMQNYHRAGLLADAALKANPQSARASLLICDIFQHRGWMVQARDMVAKLVRGNPTCIKACIRQGQVELHLGKTKAAMQAFTNAIELDQTSKAATRGLLRTLQRLGRNRGIEETLKRYLQAFPYSHWANRQLIRFLRRTGKPRAALAVADAHLANSPDDHTIIAARGYCLEELGQMAEARSAWKRALVLNPAYPSLKQYLEILDRKPAPMNKNTNALTKFVQSCKDYTPPHGHPLAYLLHEQEDTLNPGGTRMRTIHSIVRILDRNGIEDLQRKAIFFDSRIESVRVETAKVLRRDGSIAEARVIENYLGRPSPLVIEFPALGKGDVVELFYRVNRFRADFFGEYFGRIYRFRREAPVRLARYRLVTNTDGEFFFHRTNNAPRPIVTHAQDNTRTIRTWQMSELAPIESEPYMPPPENLSPAIQVSSFRDWNDLAKWYWHLIKDQNIATAPIREKVEELTRDRKSDTSKLAAIYNWVIRNIHNEAWEFGVHGYKPYSAGTIFTRGFGDCKDKATLIAVMARQVGLDAWPVLLEATDPTEAIAGRAKEDLTLPLLAHFNHCIAMVKADGRTFFLDGTVSYRTIDSIPITDAGADAVVITPNQAIRVRIPDNRPVDNLWADEISLTIDTNGYADITQDLTGSGRVAVYLRAYFQVPEKIPERFRRLSWERMIRRVSGRVYGPVRSAVAEFITQESPPDQVRLKSRVRVRQFAKQEPGRMLIPLPRAFLRGELGRNGALPGRMAVFAAHSTRQYDLVLPMAFRIQRNISITWPANWRLSNTLPERRINGDFGTFTVQAKTEGNSMEITYLLEVRQTVIPLAAYGEFRRMCILADQTDNMTLILEKE